MVRKLLKYILIAIFAVIATVLLLFSRSDIAVEELSEKYATSPSRFMNIQGMQVHYRDEGPQNDSIPVVLLHGTGSSLHTFDEWTNQLSKGRRVIRLDLPAFGLTGPFPDKDYSMKSYTDFLRDFFKSLNVDRLVIAGNSFGGQIAWNYSLVNPEQVQKLVLIDAAGYPSNARSRPIAFGIASIPVLNKLLTFITPRSVAEASVLNVYYDKSKVTTELVDRYFELTLREGNRQALVDRIQTDFPSDAHEAIKNIETPTLVLWGRQDLLIPLENAQRFHKDLPNSTLQIIEDCGHVPMEESPMSSLRVFKDFLSE
jgi:pimeloyl-ACP methyl ester carboxylesterase